jgi:hypothetical protein
MVMLMHLHNQLSEVASIYGVLAEGGKELVVQYKDDPTPDQQAEVEKILASWPLEEARLEHEEEIDQEVKEIEAKGYDTGKGYTIDLSARGAADLTGAIVLAKEAVDNGYEGPHFILASDGITHSATYEELIQVGVDYGVARNALYVAASQKTMMIREAETVSEVRLIDTKIG